MSLDAAMGRDAGPIIPADICDRTTPALGSCRSGDVCQESSDPAGWSVIQSTCVLDDSDLRVNVGCSTLQLAGRCYRDNGGFPVFTYEYGGRGSTATVALGCTEADARFCPNLPGVSDETYAACSKTCAAAKPDLSRAPECDMSFTCPDDCAQAALGLAQACADCVREAVSWPPSYCGERECTCTPPVFPKPAAPVCAAACAGAKP